MKKTMYFLSLFAGVALILTGCDKSEDLTAHSEKTTLSHESEAKLSPSMNQLIAQVRAATAKYHNPQEALADGFFDTEDCVAIPGVGGMGVHFVNFNRIDGVHNPLEPEVLVYEIKSNGGYKLVAVEYLHVGASSPMFGGEEMFHPFPQPFADYALHAWIWKMNPSGMFEDWNPNVTCP